MVHSAHSPLYFICLEQLLYIVKSFQAANDKVNRISVPLSSLLSALTSLQRTYMLFVCFFIRYNVNM